MSGHFLLIVLGRPEHRVLFNHCFADTTHRLIYAMDGEDAFDRFVEARPDVVITHVTSPKLDAKILCPLIREKSPTVPIFLYGEELTDRANARQLVESFGANGFIPMPFERDLVLGTIDPYVRSPEKTVDNMPAAVPTKDLDHASESDFEITLDAADDADLLLDPALAAAAVMEDNSHEIVTGPVEAPEELMITAEEPIEEPISAVGLTPVGHDLIEEPISTSELTPVGHDLIEEEISIEARTPVGLDLIAEEIFIEARTPVGHDLIEEPISVATQTPVVRLAPGDLLEEPMAPAAKKDRGEHGHESAPFYVLPLSMTSEDSGSLGHAQSNLPPEAQMAADLLEEPELPVRAKIEPKPVSGSARTPMSEALIREMPKDSTPSGGGLSALPVASSRRGLDESQLGKRLAGRVRKLHEVLDDLDYFELLGLQPDAEIKAIRDAYFELSLEFHPDRFFLLRSGDLKEKIYAVYRRISEAYTVLSDPRRRAAYADARQTHDIKRAPPEVRVARRSSSVTAPPVEGRPSPFSLTLESEAAQRLVTQAEELFAAEDHNGARLFLTFALAYEPNSAPLREAIVMVAKAPRPRV